MGNEPLTAWLFANSGPILRYRIAVDRMHDTSQVEREQLLQDALASPEMQRWLDNLSRSRSIHGSQDTNGENPLAKLLDYGLNRAVPAFDQSVQALLNNPWKTWDGFILYPFCCAPGTQTIHVSPYAWRKGSNCFIKPHNAAILTSISVRQKPPVCQKPGRASPFIEICLALPPDASFWLVSSQPGWCCSWSLEPGLQLPASQKGSNRDWQCSAATIHPRASIVFRRVCWRRKPVIIFTAALTWAWARIAIRHKQWSWNRLFEC